MADDRTKRGPADRSRISLSEEYEVWYWVKELGVTQADLEKAVQAVGNSVDKVREYLKTHDHARV